MLVVVVASCIMCGLHCPFTVTVAVRVRVGVGVRYRVRVGVGVGVAVAVGCKLRLMLSLRTLLKTHVVLLSLSLFIDLSRKAETKRNEPKRTVELIRFSVVG